VRATIAVPGSVEVTDDVGLAGDSPPDRVRIDPLHIGSLTTKSREARRIALRDCRGDLNGFHRISVAGR
jgi:hypothetical protein